MKRIDIPGVGPVDFPDDMSDAEIGNVIERDILGTKQTSAPKPKKPNAKPQASDYLTARDPELLDQALSTDDGMRPYTPSKKAPLTDEQREKVEFATSEDLGRVYSPKGTMGTYIREELSPMSRQNLERLKAQNKDPAVAMLLDEQLRRPSQTKQPVELGPEELAYAAGLEANKDTRGQLTDREYLDAPEPTAFEEGLAASGSSGVRAIDNFTAGELGSIGASLSYAGRKTGIDTLADVGDRMSGYAAGKTPSDQDFGDKLITGIGSAASFFVPGVGVMRGSRALSVLSPTLAKWTGAGTMAGLEAAAEADGVYREKLAQGASDQEAMAAADQAFTMNAAVLMVTDKIAFFNDIKVLDEATGKVALSGVAKTAAVGSVSEGSQEAIQAVIGNYLTDKPLMEGVAEGAAIGAIIGGGLSPLSAVYQADARKVASDAVAAIPNAATVDDAIALAQQALTTPLETTSVSTTNSLAPLATGTPELGSDLGSGGGTDILSGGGSSSVYAGGAPLADPLGGGVELNNAVGVDSAQLDTGVAPGQLQARVDVGTGDIVSSSGAPYRTQKTAEMQLRAKGLEGQYEVKQVEGGFALAKIQQQPQAAAVPEYEDPIMPASQETVTGVESNGLLSVEPINAQENTLSDVGTQSRYAEQVAELNSEFASRAVELEARTGRRPPTIAAATSAEEQSFAPIADALKDTFGTEVVPFSDASATAPDGFAYKGTTWVNVSNLDRPAAFVAAHEFKHSMEQSKDPADRETAQWLEDNIMPLIEEVGQREYAEKFLFKGLTYEQVMANPELAQELKHEMTADFMAKRMTDRSFLDSLAKRDPVGFSGFVQKWVKAIDGLVKSLRGKKGLGRSDIDKHITDLNKAKLIAQEALVRWRKNAMERQGVSSSGKDSNVQFAKKAVDLPTGKDLKSVDRSSVSLIIDPAKAKTSLGLEPGKNSTRKIGEALNRVAQERGAIAEDDYSPEAADVISDAMLQEVKYQLGGPRSGLGWYSNEFQDALNALASEFPEIATDAGKRNSFTALLAITSNGEKVKRNLAMAKDLYRVHRAGGDMLSAIPGTKRAAALEGNIKSLIGLIDMYGEANVKEVLLDELTVKDLNAQMRAKGEKVLSAYTADMTLPKAALYFGPKLGAFYANLSGSQGFLTMDLWWTRTFNRIRGALLPSPTDSAVDWLRAEFNKPRATVEELIELARPHYESYKAKNYKDGTALEKRANTFMRDAAFELNEVPTRATERRFMVKTAEVLQTKLKKEGYDLSIADIQAALWYYEKRLFGALGSRVVEDVGYIDAIRGNDGQQNQSDRSERSSARGAGTADQGQDGGRNRGDVPLESQTTGSDSGDGSGRAESGSAADRSLQTPKRPAQERLGKFDPLPGAPSVPGFTGPDPRLVDVAETYARENGITLVRQSEYALVDEARATRIAEAYEAMEHAPQDPVVREAYENLIAQTTAQYRALEAAGYRFWFIDLEKQDNQEYASTPWNAMRDIRANKTMGVFPTEEGFGSEGDFEPTSNPLLADTGFQWPSGSVDGPLKRVLANDLFRAVHDAFGHGLEGAGFRARGEENAWQAHVRLFTGSAVGAITSETRGQNSWLNYGPYGEKNRTASVEDTVFADQKTGLMPEWTWMEGRSDGEYIGNDWKENPNGETYQERLRARRPDILTRAAELRARVETVDRKFNEKYGWGETSDTVRYSRKQLDGARGQGSTEPAAGAREGAVRVNGVHYSNVQRQTLDGRFYGTGIKGAEQERVLNAKDRRLRSRLYFYVDEGKGVRPEGGVGRFVHNVTLDNLYDTTSRTLSWEKDPYGDNAVTTNNFESAVLDAGYSGYYRPAAFGTQGVAVLLGDAAIGVKADAAPQFSRKELSETSQLVALNERARAKDTWGKHLDPRDHLASTEGEDVAVGNRLNSLYMLAAQRKDTFDSYIKELAKATGTKAKTAPLKKRDRSMEKIMADYNGDVADMKDVLRATIATESMTQAQELYEALSADGRVADVRGALKSTLETGTGAGYRDAKVILDVDGIPAELIIAPQSLLRAKELAHSMYAKQRSLDVKMRKATASKERALFRSQIEALDAKMVKLYLPAAQRAQSSSAVLREQGSALSRTVSMLNGLLSGSNAKNPESISATGLPSKSKNLVPSGKSSNGVDIVDTSNDIIPEGNNLRYSRKLDPKVKDWAVSIKNRKAAKPIMMIVVEPGKALNAAGIYRQVTMDEPHVRHVYNKHAEITPDDIASLPFALQNPRAGIARPDGSTRLIVDGRDAQGNPLAVALNNLNVGEGKGKIKVTEVSTLFGNEDSASLIVNSLLDGSVKYLRENEVDRLSGLMLVTKLPANVEGTYGVGIRPPLPENQSLPTSGPIANQPQVVSVQTENGVVNLRVNDDAKQLARGVQFSRKQTETPEFKAWFGDSKVVDENGRPMVVYHGTGESINEFAVLRGAIFFTPDPKFAQGFADDASENLREGGIYEEYSSEESGGANLIPVYLSLQNPFDPRNKNHVSMIAKNKQDEMLLASGGYETIENYFNEIKSAGFDGFYEKESPSQEFWNIGVFSPSQIKSAIGNNGQFDPENDDIRFARKGSPTGSQFALPDETTGEGYIRQWQNDQVRWKRQMDLLRGKGVVNDQNDVYQAMERMVARAMNRTEDFYKNNVTPVLQRMSELAVTMDEVGDYLYALHAKERNAAIRDINPRFANAGYDDVGGSGMSDAEADQIVQDTKAKANFKDIEAIAREFRSWADANLDGLVQGGLLTQEQAADMRAKYPNYVPLQGFEDVEGETMLGQGAGFSNAKDVVKRALGRGSRAGNPAVYIIHGVAEGMLAREKANVGRYLERLILDNPDDKLWTIGQPEKEPIMGKSPLRYEVLFNGNSAGTFMNKRQAQQYIQLMDLKGATIDETGGDPTVVERDLGYDPDSEVRFLRDGKQVRIQLKDPLLARAYNNRGMEEIGTILRASASINSFLREMWTQKNPVFPFVNVIRDIPAGALYATGEHGAALAARVVRNTPAAWYAMWQQASGKPITNGMDQWVKEYRLAGGGIGFRMVGDIQSTIDKINRIEKQLGNKTVMQALAGGEIKEAGKRLLWKTYNNAVTDFIERVNIAFENMTRLAIFKAAREQNLSMAEASRLAKNATVNFNRKGEKTPNLSALYLFANAAVQDVAKNKRTVMDAANRNQARAVLAAVASLGFIAAMLSDDDEDLEEENRNINNVRFKVGDSRVSIPLSYGLIGFSHYLGRSVAKVLQGEDVSLQSIRLASALITNSAPINPIPNPDRVDGTNAIIGVMPTPLEFPAEVFLNRNSFGSDMRPDYNDNPDAYKAFRGTRGSVYADIAAYLNENTGGTTREPGFIDVSPETLKGFMHFTLGGTGKFVADSASTTADILEGGEVNPNTVPLLNRFVKREDVTTYRARFYRQAGAAKEKLDLYNKYLKDGNSEKRRELAPWVILGRRGNMMWKQMNAIRDRELKISRDETLSVEERDAQLEALADKQIAISDKYHRLYKKKTSGV